MQLRGLPPGSLEHLFVPDKNLCNLSLLGYFCPSLRPIEIGRLTMDLTYFYAFRELLLSWS